MWTGHKVSQRCGYLTEEYRSGSRREGEGWGERKEKRREGERKTDGSDVQEIKMGHEELRPGVRRLLASPFTSCATTIESLYLSGPQFLC